MKYFEIEFSDHVDPIPENVARDCYDFSNENNWPVFS